MKNKREKALGDYEAIAAKKTGTHKNEVLVNLKDFNAWMKLKKKNSPSSEFVNFQSKFQSSDEYFLEKVSKLKEDFKYELMSISPDYTEL
eukprot:scaffold102705_cov67-Attheya_sp.AAC.1